MHAHAGIPPSVAAGYQLRVLCEIAAAQGGVLRACQLEAAGVFAPLAAAWIDEGRLVPLQAGVYALRRAAVVAEPLAA
jgi:hypothetical protein